jgi:hypothetical protein
MGQLDCPISIASKDGVVYVSEAGNYRVSVFGSSGYLLSFGTFSCPRGLAVDNGVLYMCDANNVQIY